MPQLYSAENRSRLGSELGRLELWARLLEQAYLETLELVHHGFDQRLVPQKSSVNYAEAKSLLSFWVDGSAATVVDMINLHSGSSEYTVAYFVRKLMDEAAKKPKAPAAKPRTVTTPTAREPDHVITSRVTLKFTPDGVVKIS